MLDDDENHEDAPSPRKSNSRSYPLAMIRQSRRLNVNGHISHHTMTHVIDVMPPQVKQVPRRNFRPNRRFRRSVFYFFLAIFGEERESRGIHGTNYTLGA
jgi:hypothetical protein